jgi:hypothetical protein
MSTEERLRHPVTGRYMSGDCERDCLEHCAGLCGASFYVEGVAGLHTCIRSSDHGGEHQVSGRVT